MPLRIIAVSNRYLPVIGGAERQLALLSAELKRRGHNIQIVTRHIVAEHPHHEIINDVPVRRLSPTGLGKLANILIIPRMIAYLVAHRNEYDIIHCQSLGPISIASIISGKFLNKPVILRIATAGDVARQETGREISNYTKFIRKYIISSRLWYAIIRQASVIVALSNEIVTEAKAYELNHLVHLIPNSVDCKTYQAVNINQQNFIRNHLELARDIPIIVTTGRLVARKRLDVLIAAMPQVIEDFPQCKVLIIGSGEHQNDTVADKLREMVKELGLETHIKFIGVVNNVKDYLAIANLFVFPSENEGLPNAVLEAMASATPIIASRIGGVIDIVDDSCAYLVPVGDVDLLARNILHALNNPQESQMKAKRGRERAEKQFSIGAIADQYEALFSSLITQKKD